MKLDAPPYDLHEIDDIFVRSNRSAEEQMLLDQRKAGGKGTRGSPEPSPKAPSPKSAAGKDGVSGADDDSGRFDRLTQPEFVGSLFRLGAMRASLLDTKAKRWGSLASAFDELITEHMIPQSYQKKDVISEMLKTNRNVTFVLDKWRDKCTLPFGLYSTVDESDATDTRGRLVNKAKLTMMNLTEFLELMKDAGVLDDEHCTVRAVTSFFVIVNMDDEIYEADKSARADEKDNAAELSLDEFMEISARICNAKMSNRDDDAPFEEVLDTWMGLFYVPAITNAAKRKQEDGGKRRKKLPKAKPSLFGNTETTETGDAVYVDVSKKFGDESGIILAPAPAG